MNGIDATIDSDLPAAAGLSSSSALIVAVTLALLRANQRAATFEELMEILPEGEEVVGARGLAGTARAASTLYAATKTGPFKSPDSGVTWKQLIVTTNDSSLPGQPKIFAIVVDPQTPSTVYAIGRFDSPSGFPLAFLKSTDSGANWSVVSKLTFSYTSGIAALLAIDPVKTNVLYTMAASDGLEVTTDGGVTWSAPTIPKPAGSASGGTPNQPSLQGVAADPNYSGVVYVVGGNASFHPGKGHLFKTSAPRSAARSVKSIPRDLSRPPSGNTGFGGAPWGIAMDTSGNLYVCDNEVGTRVHKVTPGGTRTIIAGNGSNGFSGDGGPATSAQLFEARAVAVDAAGNVYIADTGNLRVRRVDTSGNITTVAGGGNTSPNEVDGGPPTGVNGEAVYVVVDSTGNLYIYGGNRVYKVSGLSAGHERRRSVGGMKVPETTEVAGRVGPPGRPAGTRVSP